MINKLKEIQTKRLLLKAYEETDLESMLFLLQNEEIKKTFMIPDFSSKEDAIKMAKQIMRYSYDENHFEYGIYLQGELIGFINDVEIEQDVMELGYVISPKEKNKGYATETLGACIDELFRIGFSTVKAGLFEQNVASSKVMEKCGMKRIDKTEDITYQGKVQHCIYYEITK